MLHMLMSGLITLGIIVGFFGLVALAVKLLERKQVAKSDAETFSKIFWGITSLVLWGCLILLIFGIMTVEVNGFLLKRGW